MSSNSAAESNLSSKSCSACQDKPCSKHRFTMWFDKFFSVVVAIGTLGAGFTFSVIFSSLENLQNTVDTNAVRHFLIIAWLLFVLAIAIASVSAGLFHYMDLSNYRFGMMVELLGSLASLVLQLLIVAAFLMSARALKRYDEDSGMASVVIISIFGCLLIVVWIAQACESLAPYMPLGRARLPEV